MRIGLIIVSCLLIAWTVLPILPYPHWPVRIFDFPRLQIFVLLLIVIAAIFFFQHPLPTGMWILVGLLAGAAFYQGYNIFPFTPIAPTQVKRSQLPNDNPCLTILTANVLMDNRRSRDLLALIEQNDPDLILLAEVDHWWIDELQPLKTKYPCAVEYPLDNTYGMVFYSKIPVEDVDVRFLIDPDVPSILAQLRLGNGEIIRLFGLHPRPPTPMETGTSKERDAELLLVAKEIQNSTQPAIVIGDLNDVAWSHTTRLFVRVSRMLDPRIGRGLFNTYNAKWPMLRYPLDHIFHTADFSLIALDVLPDIGSDHFPVFVHLCYTPETKGNTPSQIATEDDRKEVSKKIQQGKNVVNNED